MQFKSRLPDVRRARAAIPTAAFGLRAITAVRAGTASRRMAASLGRESSPSCRRGTRRDRSNRRDDAGVAGASPRWWRSSRPPRPTSSISKRASADGARTAVRGGKGRVSISTIQHVMGASPVALAVGERTPPSSSSPNQHPPPMGRPRRSARLIAHASCAKVYTFKGNAFPPPRRLHMARNEGYRRSTLAVDARDMDHRGGSRALGMVLAQSRMRTLDRAEIYALVDSSPAARQDGVDVGHQAWGSYGHCPRKRQTPVHSSSGGAEKIEGKSGRPPFFARLPSTMGPGLYWIARYAGNYGVGGPKRSSPNSYGVICSSCCSFTLGRQGRCNECLVLS